MVAKQFKTVMVTGHRTQQFNETQRRFVIQELTRITEKLTNEYGMTDALTGMAIGVDLWFARVNLDIGNRVHGYIPFPQQPQNWTLPQQAEYREIMADLESKRVVSPTYAVWAFHERNGLMVRDSDLTIAVWDSSIRRGGTYSTLVKARNAGKPILVIDSNKYAIIRENF